MTSPGIDQTVGITNDLVGEMTPETPAQTPFNENDAPSSTELVEAAPSIVSSAPRVVLVGMPGSGKSTIGRRVASALNLPIVDSDVLIEQAMGTACGEVFADLGEEKFRELEEEYVARALATGGVVSLGGGAVLSASTRGLLQRHTVVWIDVTAEEGIRRTAEDDSRPVLNAGGGDGENGAEAKAQRYRDLMEEREPFYREVSDFRVRTDERPPQRVVAEILGFIETE